MAHTSSQSALPSPENLAAFASTTQPGRSAKCANSGLGWMLDFSSDYWPSLSVALVGVLGVMLGVVVTAHREQRRWKKDQVLRAAVDFVGATSSVHDDRRGRSPH